MTNLTVTLKLTVDDIVSLRLAVHDQIESLSELANAMRDDDGRVPDEANDGFARYARKIMEYESLLRKLN